jgi:DNA polymerase elongation subunit (family B)
MNLCFLEEEKEEVSRLSPKYNYNFISKNNLDNLKCDILFVFNKMYIQHFINDILFEKHNILETLEIDYIIIGDLNTLNLLCDNFENISITKFDEDYGTKSTYKFFRVNDKKMYTIIKNFDNYYYVPNESGKFLTFDGKKCTTEKDYFCEHNITYEKDINKFKRFAIDKSNKLKITGDFRVLYFDIETNASVDAVNTPGEILSIVCQDSTTKELKEWVIDSDKPDLLSQEKQMLTEFLKYVSAFDVITGWNVMKFDIPYVLNRALKLGINTSICSFVSANVSCKYKGKEEISPWFIKIIGLNLYDMMTASVRSLAYLDEKLKDTKLDTVAEAVLGERKLKTDTPAVLFKNKKIKELLDYNEQDVLLLMKLDLKIGITELLIATIQIVPGLNLEDANYNSKVIDFYLLSKFDVVFPTVNKDRITDIEGAVVFDPVQGIHKNVAVFDISGMYPSLIRTFNISPDCIDINGDIVLDKYKYTSSKEGILVKLVSDFTALRKKYKEMKKEHLDEHEYKLAQLKEWAIKKVLASVYGVFGYIGFRLFSNDIANSITYAGRQLLVYMREFAENSNCKVILGDTDSIFMKADEGYDFDKLCSDMNAGLKLFVSKFTNSEKIIDNHKLFIEFETLFNKIIVPPAKKKYLGLVSLQKGKKLDKLKLYFKGSELNKKDVPTGLKHAIKELVLAVLLNNDESNNISIIKEKISNIKKNICSTKIDDLLIYKEINRDFGDYKVKPMHVRAAIDSNMYLNTTFSRQDYKGGILFVKSRKAQTDNSKKIVNAVFLQPGMELTKDFEVDYDKYYEKFVLDKIKLIFGEIIYNEVTRKNNLLSCYI